MNYLLPDAPTLNFRSPSWHEDAACANPRYDSDWWFPERKNDGALAKRICETECPDDVRRQCLNGALDRLERWGIHAGIDFERDRRELTRRVA